MNRSEQGVLPARYRDPVRIAVGGMGTVWRAHDELLGRTVAVKVPAIDAAGGGTTAERFRREAISGARIHHPNVAVVYDVGEHADRPYMVMEHVGGGSLADRIAAGRVPRLIAMRWIAQTAAALDAAHAVGVVHRDVKPANLLLDDENRVKVVDFGIARVLGETGGTLTAAGTVLGSSGYASPEQAQGLPVTSASDVYSLGAVAFELLTGERPYAGRAGIAELSAHAYAEVPSAAERNASVSPRLDAVLARALAKDPDARFPSAGAFAEALRAAAHADAGPDTVVMPPPAASTGGPSARRRPARGRRTLVATAAAVLVGAAVAIAAVTATRGGDGTDPEALQAARAQTVVRTVTGPASPPRTVVQTVTAPAAAAPPATTEAAPAEAQADPVALTDRSTAALARGDAAAGLALAQQALATLAGTGDDYEGNASYNLGRALLDLGRCDEAVAPLERAVEIGGSKWQEKTRRSALKETRHCDR